RRAAPRPRTEAAGRSRGLHLDDADRAHRAPGDGVAHRFVVVALHGAEDGLALRIELECARRKLGAVSEPGAEGVVDHDLEHHALLSSAGVGRTGRVSTRQAVANTTEPTAPR